MDTVKRQNFIIITSASVIIIILAFVVFYFVRKANQKEAELADVVQTMNFEKEQVQKEYANLNQEFDGITTNIKNEKHMYSV